MPAREGTTGARRTACAGGAGSLAEGGAGSGALLTAHGRISLVLVSAGWILATTAAAGANRVLRRS
ncbi:hypothetical protein [Streptomyces sp. NPDC048282]|uniref:hypothetical protein n=1 Tax=unclassified Streptomyces TaxID=2593676 RepID=UPI00371AD93B